MAKGIPWTEMELEILRTYFSTEGSMILRRLPGRTYSSVTMMARRMGLSFPRGAGIGAGCRDAWTAEEDAVLRKYYPLGVDIVRGYLPHRSDAAIRQRGYLFGLVSERKSGWTPEEDTVLCKYYPVEGADVVARLPGRSRDAVYNRVNALGLGSKRVRWTPEEDEVLRKCWTSDEDLVFLCSRLPGRSVAAIKQRVFALGLCSHRLVNKRTWTTKEDAVLCKYYPSEGKRVASRLPGRTVASCAQRAQQLGVRYTGR